MSEFDIGLLDVPGTLMMVLDPGGRVLLWNRACSDLSGYLFDEIRGRHLWDFLLVPDGTDMTKECLAALRTGGRPKLEHYWITKRGERHWIAWSLNATRRPNGPVEFVVGIGVDRTENKRAEEALRLSEEKFEGIISIAADAIISIDSSQRIALYNEGAKQIFGYSSEEILGQPLDILLPERFQEIHRRHVDAFRTGPVRSRGMGEHRPAIFGRRKSGEEFPAEAAISKLDVEGDQLLTVVLRDVTDRKRREDEQRFLAEVGEVFTATLDFEETLSSVANLAVPNLADGCIVDLLADGDRAHRFKIAQHGLESAVEAEFQRILKKGPPFAPGVLHTASPLVVADVTQDTLRTVAPNDDQLRVLQALHPRSLMVVPLRVHRRCLGLLVLLSSQPGRKYGERDVALAEELARRAAFAVENAHLYQSAQQASRARDELLAIVAHDLRNPLSTIRTAAELLLRRLPAADRDGARKQAQVIIRSSERADRLIRDLLDVTRIEAGGLALEQTRVPAPQVVRDVVELNTPSAVASSLTLHADLQRALPEIWADRDRLLQVFENLLANAVKFTSAGGHLVVGAEPREGNVLFWVSDTGCGIAEDDLPHIFDRFWQARKGDLRGAGLGLPICKGIVEAHGGRIWVESKVHSGSTFFFAIPMAPAIGDVPAAFTPPPS